MNIKKNNKWKNSLRKPIGRSNIFDDNDDYNKGKSGSIECILTKDKNNLNLNNILNSVYFKDKYKINDVVLINDKKIILKLIDINGTYFIVKIFCNSYDYKNNYEVYKILHSEQCNQIIYPINFIIDDFFWCVIYEYFEGYNLEQYIKTKELDYNEILFIFKQIAQGIKHLHDNNIIHCDIKLGNVLINGNNIKIIDFDLSKISNDYFISDHVFGTLDLYFTRKL